MGSIVISLSIEGCLIGVGPPDGYHISISSILLYVVPLLFVEQKLFNQPSVVLQEELLYI